MRRFLHSSIRVIFLLTIGALIWTGWYASTHGFSRKWRERVTKELRKLGAQVYVHRLTLDPLRGLVAREVVISDPRNPQTHFATINRVVLDINYSNLLHGEPFLNAVDLHDAEVTLPLDPADPASERVNISRLSARLLLSADELYLSQAEAQIAGMQISAHGRLQNPRAFKPSPTAAPGGGAGRSAFETLLKELRSTHFEGGPPQIEIEFGGDIAEPRTLFADATLWGEKVRRGSYVIENCFASLSYRDRACELKRCSLSDAHGAFDASGSYDFVSAKATLRVRSTIDLQALTHSLRVPHLLDEFVFYDPPLLEFSAEGVLGKESQIKLLGRVELGKFAFKSALFEEAATSFSYDGSRWYLRGSHLRDRTGKITANALQESGNFRAQLSSSINPRSLLPLLSGKPAQLLGEWDFAQSPQIELAVSGASPDIAQCEAQGEIKLGRTRMRGVPLKSASAIMRVKDNVVSYENFRVDRDEGSG
ncbi:MAG: hypothetical protein QOD99_2044, partial [Chthoniobacter sp.]|nr:hypothetical protein [Chthoniobacter sp.]